MSVYFLDHCKESLRHTVPKSLPEFTEQSDTDLLDHLGSSRREKQSLSRNIVECHRNLKLEAKDSLQNFKRHQNLKLMHFDSCLEHKERIKAIDMRLARAAHLPPQLQDSILAERKSAVEEMATIMESYNKVKVLLESKMRNQEQAVNLMSRSRNVMQKMLSTSNTAIQKVSAFTPRESNFELHEMLDSAHETLKLASFLRSENLNSAFHTCLSFGIHSIKSLALTRKDVMHGFPIEESEIEYLLLANERAKAALDSETAQKMLQSGPFAPLFPHRMPPQNSKIGTHNKLMEALQSKDIRLLHSILSSDSEQVINIQNEDGWTLLHRAAAMPDHAVVTSSTLPSLAPTMNDGSNFIDLLLEFSADVNLKNKYGRTPLHYAAMEGNLASCLSLLNAGAKAEDQDFYEMRAIDHAKLMKRADWYRVCGLLYLKMPPEMEEWSTDVPRHNPQRKKKIMK